jgi:hypothetical protein
MAIDADMTHRSNALFSAIVATVAASKGGKLTVLEIAQRVGARVDTTAACIALHRHFQFEARHGERETGALLALPLTPDLHLPAAEDMIDETALGLEPRPRSWASNLDLVSIAADQVIRSGPTRRE